jgi:hypothetical protein
VFKLGFARHESSTEPWVYRLSPLITINTQGKRHEEEKSGRDKERKTMKKRVFLVRNVRYANKNVGDSNFTPKPYLPYSAANKVPREI